MNPIVVDTNCMAYFQKERLDEHFGEYSRLIDEVCSKGHISLDVKGKIKQEYADTCSPGAVGLNLLDWLADMATKGIVREYEEASDLKQKCDKCGLPSKDYKWVGTAIGAEAKLIVSEDIDLFEPKAKTWKAARKEQIKANSEGSMAKLLKKNGIAVRCRTGAMEKLLEW